MIRHMGRMRPLRPIERGWNEGFFATSDPIRAGHQSGGDGEAAIRHIHAEVRVAIELGGAESLRPPIRRAQFQARLHSSA